MEAKRGMEATPETRQGAGLRRALPGALWLLLAAAVAWQLGGYALLDPDEGRNAEVAREMMAGGDYVLPRLDGLPYLDKPVLYFAADALCQRLLGADETAARLPSLLCALTTAALTGWFAGRLFGRRARQVAAVAALAAPLPLAFARTVIFDSMLAFFMVLALCAFYLAVEARVRQRAGGGEAAGPAAGKRQVPGTGQANGPGNGTGQEPGTGQANGPGLGSGQGSGPASGPRPEVHDLRWTLVAWLAMALGVLTKGPVALAVPLLAAAPYAVVRRASRAVWHPLGPALLALVVGPWIWAMSRQVPEFLHYALFTETWQRVTTPEMNREGPFWFFIPCLVAGSLPWSVLALGGWRRSLRPRAERRDGGRAGRGGRIDPARLYLALWIGLPLVLFSLSHSKRPQYILPLLPAVALMAAKVWVDALDAETQDAGAVEAGGAAPPAAESSLAGPEGPASGNRFPGPVPGARAAAWTWLALALLCGGGALAVPHIHAERLAHVALLPRTLAEMAAAFLAGAALAALGTRFHRRLGPALAALGGSPRQTGAALLLAGLVLPMAAMPALLVPLLDEIAGHRSSRAAAAAILPRLSPGAEVVAIHAFPPSLPFYLRRTLLVATPRGRELTSNYVIAYFQKWIAADPRRTPLRPADWWRRALAACDHPLVFVTWADDAATRAQLAAASLPEIVANDRMAAYGPCTARSHAPPAQR
jgi:4-amino-4-deoxy-L-arabinose transferase-like glycosyltransferase